MEDTRQTHKTQKGKNVMFRGCKHLNYHDDMMTSLQFFFFFIGRKKVGHCFLDVYRVLKNVLNSHL